MFRRTAPIALGLALAGAAGAAVAEDLAYEAAGESFAGYFAAADEPRGLVVIVHDWDGLDDYERRRADMLAELGYDAAALDVYGGGATPGTMEERVAATQAAFADPERLQSIVAAGIEAARGRSEADGTVMIGYCFGGTVTLATTRAGTAELAGVASFHGNFPEGPAWPEDAPPILVLHGGADENPSMTDVAAFVAEAEEAGLDYDLEVYSGAPHAFTVFGSDRYRERADARSWAEFQRFLEETLGGEAS